MVSTYEKGRQGEEAAVQFLVGQGYEILERNFRCRAGEIDIIGRDGECCCFIEVKMRVDVDVVPQEAVNPLKKHRMGRAAYAFLKKEGIDPFEADCRFDVLAVQLDHEGEFCFELFRDAFWLDER